ncbi:MAG: hypothetical protein ACRYE9_03645 [Janthinobacterium lividum]
MITGYEEQLFSQPCWNFLSGKVENSESANKAAIRGVFEQTNLLIIKLKKVGSFKIEIEKKLWKAYIYSAE